MSLSKGKLIGIVWLGTAIILSFFLAFGFSALVRFTPWSWELKLAPFFGRGNKFQQCIGRSDSRHALQKLVKRIYPVKNNDNKFSLEVEVVHDKNVNAFATLGGRIYINEALLVAASKPEELAGVLAHEIEHVRNRHVLEGLIVRLVTVEGIKFYLLGESQADIASTFLHMSFSRTEEAQADSEGVLRLRLANVSVKGFYDFFNRMEKESTISFLLSDHPNSTSRLEKIKPFLEVPGKEVLNETEWKNLKEICN